MSTRGPDASRLPLPAAELHVWTVWLDQPANVAAELARVLSADERERAARFAFDHLTTRYLVARGSLRTLLARYIEARPKDIQFRYGEHGKPSLAGAGPWFNLSHSGAVALLAFSGSAEVGIDVELVDRAVAAGAIAERFFSPSECQSLRSLPEALQPRAFLACWTRKEAFIKARGDGLTLSLDSFDVTLAPGEPAALLRTAWSADEPAEWGVADVSDPAGQFVAAVASRARGWRVVHRGAHDIAHEQVATGIGGEAAPVGGGKSTTT